MSDEEKLRQEKLESMQPENALNTFREEGIDEVSNQWNNVLGAEKKTKSPELSAIEFFYENLEKAENIQNLSVILQDFLDSDSKFTIKEIQTVKKIFNAIKFQINNGPDEGTYASMIKRLREQNLIEEFLLQVKSFNSYVMSKL